MLRRLGIQLPFQRLLPQLLEQAVLRQQVRCGAAARQQFVNYLGLDPCSRRDPLPFQVKRSQPPHLHIFRTVSRIGMLCAIHPRRITTGAGKVDVQVVCP